MTLYEILALKANKGVQEINKIIGSIQETIIIEGMATEGGINYLMDDTKNFLDNSLKGKLITFTLDGIQYMRKILGNTADTIMFDVTAPHVNAFIIVGTGEESEGQFTISCRGDLAGSVGNDYSFQVLETDKTNGDVNFELDDVNKIFKVLVDKNGMGETMPLMVGNLDTSLKNSEFNTSFVIEDGWSPGFVPFMEEPLDFAGGIDGAIITVGTKYVIKIDSDSGSGIEIVILTQDEYDELTPEEQEDENKIYFIKE